MPDPHKITLGKPLLEYPGQWHNDITDLVMATKAAQKPVPPQISIGKRSYLTIQLHNSTSENLEPGHILGYEEPAISLEDDEPQFHAGVLLKGITPAVPEHDNQFAVALDFIRGSDDSEGGAVGDAAFQGLIPVRVNWTDDSHTKVKVAEGETLLQSGTSGLTPVWHEEIPEDLPAELWALVLLGGGSSSTSATSQLAVARTDITAASSSLIEDWGGGDISFIDDLGQVIDEIHAISNRWPIAYPEGAMIDYRGPGNPQGTCGPAPEGFWHYQP